MSSHHKSTAALGIPAGRGGACQETVTGWLRCNDASGSEQKRKPNMVPILTPGCRYAQRAALAPATNGKGCCLSPGRV